MVLAIEPGRAVSWEKSPPIKWTRPRERSQGEFVSAVIELESGILRRTVGLGSMCLGGLGINK